MTLSADKLNRMSLCGEALSAKWIAPLNVAMERFEIDTPIEIAGFIAQVTHESSKFSRLRENMNYSAERLLVVFPKYFKDKATADLYARQPEKIANRVYANRYGNGPESSGDGYKYRGGGLIQLTFKANYEYFGKLISIDLVSNPSLIETPQVAALTAAAYWKTKGLNEVVVRDDDMKDETKIIQGGSLGLKERDEIFHRCCQIMGFSLSS